MEPKTKTRREILSSEMNVLHNAIERHHSDLRENDRFQEQHNQRQLELNKDRQRIIGDIESNKIMLELTETAFAELVIAENTDQTVQPNAAGQDNSDVPFQKNQE